MLAQQGSCRGEGGGSKRPQVNRMTMSEASSESYSHRKTFLCRTEFQLSPSQLVFRLLAGIVENESEFPWANYGVASSCFFPGREPFTILMSGFDEFACPRPIHVNSHVLWPNRVW